MSAKTRKQQTTQGEEYNSTESEEGEKDFTQGMQLVILRFGE
jgi:hypothetical protein